MAEVGAQAPLILAAGSAAGGPLAPVRLLSPVGPVGLRMEDLLLALRRAPTLLSGELAGAHGPVQVWAPDRSLVRRQSLLQVAGLAWGLAYLRLVWLLLERAPAPEHLACGLLLIGGTLLLFVLALLSVRVGRPLWALKRPCYITTDSVGIGITTPRGSRCLRWDTVVRCLREDEFSLTFLTRGRDRARADLSGYPREAREELSRLVRQKLGVQAIHRLPPR